MTATTALVVGALASIGTLLATIRVRRPSEGIFPVMMVGWLVGELAVFHLVLQAVALVLLVRAGVLDHVRGAVGVALLGASMGGLVAVQRRAATAARVFERALAEAFGSTGEERPVTTSWRQAWLPFWFGRRGVDRVRNVAYGDNRRRNLLDVYRPVGSGAATHLPVVVYVHGGAWVIGNKEQQGKPLMLHLARNGYIGVSINYRLASRHRWPAQIIDVKRAVAWVREHIAEYGGDPSFLAIAGSSAGGHLAALTALTAGDSAFQPGFEDADASVDACVPIYAPFDLTDHAGLRGRAALRRFMERLVMPTRLRDDPDTWRTASPYWRVHAGAPPMLVIQGQLDTLVWREEAHAFVLALRAVSNTPVVMVEVPGAQHAFEIFNSVRSRAAVVAIGRFLDAVRVAETTLRE